jgi:type I restriction enzyme S subunit
MEENQTQIPDGWKKTSFGDKEMFRIIGSGIKHFSGEKEYYSTSSIDGNKVLFAEQLITFKNRPSRANMQPIESSVWFAKMKNTFKILKAQRKEIEEVILSTGFSGIESETVDCDYLMQILSSSEFNSQKNLLAEGSTQEAVNNTKIKEIKFLLPESKQEQTQIARTLSKVDEAIAQTEQLIAKYTRIKTGLMQDLLTKGIDEHGNIRSEQTHEFKDSPLGRIPKEWECDTLISFCEKIQDGTHFSPKTDSNGNYKYITSKNIRMGYLDLSNLEFINEDSHKIIYRRCSVKYGDVLLTKDGASTGNICLNPLDEEFSLLSSVALIRGKKDKLFNEYIVQFFMEESGQKSLIDQMSGNAITRITLTKINKTLIKVPTFKEQNLIVQNLKPKDDLIIHEKIQLTKLQSLKTGLMQDLLSGKVRVNHLIKETASA